MPNRRTFIQSSAAVAVAASLPALDSVAARSTAVQKAWYRHALRWGQTNLTEVDPARIDIGWWREHWKRTRIQGVVLNAGGIIAYYPTAVPFHRRARELGGRDLFGELRQAAKEDGLVVFARMDSNRADEKLYRAHPDWFAHDINGKPYVSTGLYIACVNSPYYHEYIPSILKEIAARYRPEGFTDNNWNGPMRDQPCFCEHCAKSFRERSGAELPKIANWNDPLYREWIMWNYARRLEIWDHFNRVTQAAGGTECIWVGMMAGAQSWQSRVFRDDREIYRRTPMIMLDHQRRFDNEGFQHNGETGKRLRSVGGWDKVIPESMAMYHLTEHNFRLATKPAAEVRLWAVEAFAGGLQPWWHHLGAVQEDRRMFNTAEPLWRWHEANEQYLVDRMPVASVGLVWSQRNMDFFGRDEGDAHVDDPWNGFSQALIRARIPYLPIHADDIERVSSELDLRLLILPNLGALSDSQVASIRSFVARGGNLLATGQTSLCDEWGVVRDDLALAELFGAHLPADHGWRDESTRSAFAKDWRHTYLRLPPQEGRHETLQRFTDTDILAFGGELGALQIRPGAEVALSFIPSIPISPPEDVWMREPQTTIPGLIFNSQPNGSRVVYLPADIDRRFAREYLPDHGDLLASLVRWAVKEELPVHVEGAGLIDCHLYRQSNRLLLHLVNLTNANTWRTPVHELIPVGPLKVRVRTARPRVNVQSRVANIALQSSNRNGWCELEVPTITDHELIVIEEIS